MDTMSKINKLLFERRIAGYKLCEAIGLSRGVYSQWNTGKTSPSKRNLQLIADYFGVDYNDLLPDDETNEKTPAPQSEGLSGLDQDLVKAILSLSESEKVSLYAFLTNHKRGE